MTNHDRMPVAVLADVHGNSWALDAVLSDARAAGVETFINLGDCVYGPLDPRGTMERLLELNAVTVRGNQDRGLLTGERTPTGDFVRAQLTPAQLVWLE